MGAFCFEHAGLLFFAKLEASSHKDLIHHVKNIARNETREDALRCSSGGGGSTKNADYKELCVGGMHFKYKVSDLIYLFSVL
jgi:hypothetical protein